MIAIYEAIDTLTQELTDVGFKTVTFGSISETDINKQNLYPLANINLANTTLSTKAIIVNVNLMVADLVDWGSSVESTKNKTDNRLSIFNDLAYRLSKVFAEYSRNVEVRQFVNDNITIEPFESRLDNVLAGYEVILTLELDSDQEAIC